MAIEIREINIKTQIIDRLNSAEHFDGSENHSLEKMKEEIIDTCIQRMMDELRRRDDR